MDLQTLFLGEPEYDNNGRIVGRKLGVQNMIAWLFIGFIGYQLMGRGGKKQKGGNKIKDPYVWWIIVMCVVSAGGAFIPGWCHMCRVGRGWGEEVWWWWARFIVLVLMYIILTLAVLILGFIGTMIGSMIPGFKKIGMTLGAAAGVIFTIWVWDVWQHSR